MSGQRCAIENCTYLTSFERCDNHAVIGDVNFKKCIICLSSKAKFGDSIPLRCVEHKVKTDYDLGTCFHVGCYRVPKYCIGVGLTPTFCFEHYPDGYIHVGICIHENCGRRSSYGSVEDGIIRYCQLHKRVDDKNLKSRNTSSRMCGIDGCTKQGNFGITKRTRCSLHKQSGDTLVSNRICSHPGCSKSSTFGLNGKRTHCIAHKMYDAKNLVNRKRRRKESEFDIEEFKILGDNNLEDLILGLDFNF